MTLVQDILHTGGSKPRVEIYYDDINNIEYVCDADTGSALTSKVRKIRKIIKEAVTNRTLKVLVAGGEYDQVATDLSTVEALSFS